MVADRGQLLLVGAILFSVVVVGIVVQLNDLQYTDTMASNGQTDVVDRAVQTEAETRDALVGLVTRVRADTDRSEFGDALRENVSTYQNYSENMTAAGSATYTNVTVNESASKNLSEVSDSTGNFKAPDSSDNTWVVSNDTEFVDAFWLNATNAANSPDDFSVKISNGSNDWVLYINGNPSTFDVQTSNATTTGRETHCTETDAKLNLVTGSSPDTTCDFTPLGEDLEPPYNISFRNGNKAGGEFKFVVYGDINETNTSPTDGGIMYPAIDYQYRSPSTSYNRTFVVGGEGS